MARNPLRRKPDRDRPEIWASGGQRPPLDLRALGRAGLVLSREGVAPLHAWAARALRSLAVGVKMGKGRLPADKLGPVARILPSHLRVAAWVKNLAATLSHASATADPDVRRGNALVAEIAPHLWEEPLPPNPAPAAPPMGEIGPVVLQEPPPLRPPGGDPLASIRAEMVSEAASRPEAEAPDHPPAPPGPVTEAVIQVSGYLIGWMSAIAALPYGLGRALWLWMNGRDLKTIGTGD